MSKLYFGISLKKFFDDYDKKIQLNCIFLSQSSKNFFREIPKYTLDIECENARDFLDVTFDVKIINDLVKIFIQN